MLSFDSFFIRKQFYYVLFLRNIFLSFNFFCIGQVLSQPTSILHKLRVNLLQKQVKMFMINSAARKYLFSSNSSLNFFGAHSFIFYSNDFNQILDVFSFLEDYSFIVLTGLLYKKHFLSIPRKFVDYYKNLFIKYESNKFSWLRNFFGRLMKPFISFSSLYFVSVVYSVLFGIIRNIFVWFRSIMNS